MLAVGRRPKYYIVCYPNGNPRSCKEALKLYHLGEIGKKRVSRLCGGDGERHLARLDALLVDVIVADKNYTNITGGVRNKTRKKEAA